MVFCSQRYDLTDDDYAKVNSVRIRVNKRMRAVAIARYRHNDVLITFIQKHNHINSKPMRVII